MIVLDQCQCNLCGCNMGQLLQQPASPDIDPADTFHVCPDCIDLSTPADEFA